MKEEPALHSQQRNVFSYNNYKLIHQCGMRNLLINSTHVLFQHTIYRHLVSERTCNFSTSICYPFDALFRHVNKKKDEKKLAAHVAAAAKIGMKRGLFLSIYPLTHCHLYKREIYRARRGNLW